MGTPEKLDSIGRQPRDKKPNPDSAEKVTCVVSGRGNKRQVKKETTKFHRIDAKKEEKLVETDDESERSNPRRRQATYKGWNS